MDGRPTRVGYWMTEKKIRRLNFEEFVTICRNAGIELVKIDFDQPLEAQGPYSVILHKLTDQMTSVTDGARNKIEVFQHYIDMHPEIIVIDPIDNVMRLLDRRYQYQDVKDCDLVEKIHYKLNRYILRLGLKDDKVLVVPSDSDCHYFIPSFVELTSSDVHENWRRLQEYNVRFPCVCKPSVSHLFPSSFPCIDRDEEMAIIFNKKGLADIKAPCIAQSFINHNARLFKIFVVGQKHFIVQRPSIRNLYDCNQETIYFNSNDVSKSNSSSDLNQLDENDLSSHPLIEPDCKKMEIFVRGIQKKIGLDLLGVDLIIENDTGRYAVIDINAFPGYDGVPEFFNVLLQLILEKIVLFNNLAAYKCPMASELPQNFSNSICRSEEVDDGEESEGRRNRVYSDSHLSGTSVISNRTLGPKETCSFLPPGSRYFYSSLPRQCSHPALCVCYRDLTSSGIAPVTNRDRTAVINRFSLL